MGVPVEGTTLEYSTDGGSTYLEIGYVKSIKPPGGEVTSVPTHHLKSAAKTKRPGKIPDWGQIEFSIWFDPSDADIVVLRGLVATPATYKWRITYADTFATHAKDVFDGFLVSLDADEAEDEADFEATVTVEISGAVTRTAGSA